MLWWPWGVQRNIIKVETAKSFDFLLTPIDSFIKIVNSKALTSHVFFKNTTLWLGSWTEEWISLRSPWMTLTLSLAIISWGRPRYQPYLTLVRSCLGISNSHTLRKQLHWIKNKNPHFCRLCRWIRILWKVNLSLSLSCYPRNLNRPWKHQWRGYVGGGTQTTCCHQNFPKVATTKCCGSCHRFGAWW